jgi:2'-5' RNA ligase
MLYALVFRPQIDTSKIDGFRRKHDPHVNLIQPHITLVFPINDKNIDKAALEKHIKDTLKEEKPFKIHLQGLDKSWDHWLNLVLKEGNDEVIALHDKLYTGILAPFFRKDLGYIPHIGIGLFVTNQVLDKNKYKLALQEAESLNLDYWVEIDNLELVTLDDNVTKILDIKKFDLSH